MLSMEGYFWIVLAIFFGVALLFSCCGFKKFVWFLSVGYGLAIFGIGVTALILGFGKFPFSKVVSFDWPTLLLSILLVLYGLRLSSFLIYREAKSLSYRKTLEKVAGKEEKKMPFFLKATIWIFCSVLYVMETFPVLYGLKFGSIIPFAERKKRSLRFLTGSKRPLIFRWCVRQGSNLHGIPHALLRRTRIPIPPLTRM